MSTHGTLKSLQLNLGTELYTCDSNAEFAMRFYQIHQALALYTPDPKESHKCP
jgi:hypothetical protein